MTSQDAAVRAAIGQVTTGMRVVDVTGADIGTVDLVQRGDPNAVAVQAPTTDPGSSIDELVESVAPAEPDVPADLAARLLRSGYLKITGPTPARYALAEQIDTVTDQQVRLAVPATELACED